MDDIARYFTDDSDINNNELVIFCGGNGDWYVGVAKNKGGGCIGNSVRITTSGVRVPKLAVAIAQAFHAIKDAEKYGESISFRTEKLFDNSQRIIGHNDENTIS